VGFDAILNIIWLLLGLVGIAVTVARPTKSRSPILCSIGVALIVAALFPIISATDDVIRIQHLERTHASQKSNPNSDSHRRTGDNLVRLFEAMESPVAVAPIRISFTLFFAFLLLPLCIAYVRQRTVSQGGRSPPLASRNSFSLFS
jgi:hypothetical protein